MIDSFFKRENKIVLALTGGPGFGKSQIAKQYAHTYYKNYDLIWWIDAQQDIPNQYEKLAHALNTLLPKTEQIIPSRFSKDVLVDMVKNLLRLKQIRYLLIFDNPKTYAQVEKFVPIVHAPLDKHVLLTSRNANIWYDKIEIGKFKREESLSMIKRTLPQEKKEDMIRLAEILSDYPLGLFLALRFIKSHPTVTLDKYIAMHFKRPLKEKEDSSSPLLDNYPTNALSTLEISLKFIEEESKDSLQTLYFMSLLNSKDIPESYIDLWLKETNSSLPADDAIKHVYDQSLIGVSETTDFNVNKKLEGKEKVHYLSIHDLIHQLINEQIPTNDKKDLINKGAKVLLEVFAGPSEVFTKKILEERIHLLHAQKLCEGAKAIHYSSSNLLKLKIAIFECLMGSVRDIDTARIYLDDIEKDLKEGYSVDPYFMALFNMNKAFMKSSYPDHEGAIYFMQKALFILDSLKGYDEERLRALSNLSQYHNTLGQTEIALTYIEQGESLFQKSTSEVFNCFFIYVWALILNEIGKFEESLNVLKKSKKYYTLASTYPTVYHALLHQRIATLINLNLLDEASKTLNEFEEQTKAFYQKRKSTIFATVLLLRSILSINLKKTSSQSQKDLKEVLQIYKDFYKADKKHRNQGKAHLVLGKAYVLQKDFKNAVKEFLLSHEIYDAFLKEKKIDDVSDLYKELAILGTKLKDDKLTHKYLNAHIETFGLDHPRTEEILKHLDQLNLDVPN